MHYLDVSCFALVLVLQWFVCIMFCSGATKGALCATGSKLSKPSGSTTGPPGRDLLGYLDTSIMFKSFCSCKIVSKPSGSTTRQAVLSSSYLTSVMFLFLFKVGKPLECTTIDLLSYLNQSYIRVILHQSDFGEPSGSTDPLQSSYYSQLIYLYENM